MTTLQERLDALKMGELSMYDALNRLLDIVEGKVFVRNLDREQLQLRAESAERRAQTCADQLRATAADCGMLIRRVKELEAANEKLRAELAMHRAT